MNAHIARAMQSASEISIETATSQKISADIIPFPARGKQPEAEAEAVSVELEPVELAIVAKNDNAPVGLPSAEPVVGASALIERARLTRAVEIVNSVIEKRNTIPILSNVALVGTGEALSLTGTDLDIEIAVTIPAAADREFGTTLPAHLLKDLLKKATASDFVAITTGEDRDSLDFERVQYHLQPLSLNDWPHLAGPAASAFTFQLPGKAFWDGIDSTMGAVSTEETRYYLNGIYLHTVETEGGSQLRMVATDGHRLYRQDIDAPEGSAGMPDVIIPRKTVSLFHKLMKGKACPESVTIAVTETKVRLSFDDIVITSKTVDGTFPDYQRVIPAWNDKTATMDADGAIEAIRAVSLISLISRERGRSAKFTFTAGNCRLTVNNPDSGSAVADIACDYDGDEFEIGFNAGYTMAIIEDARGNGSSFTMKFSDAGSPALVTGDRAGWMSCLMPMRV
ncbi:DNA polymerase III subunit beta [Rhizobium azibense]|uniref:Beta sliding clamp n=1 Tax=Rhizobium azibense TaxID=1136135 RepID=A0A4R3RKE4_9HYPH|nr:DNA polymerase III subunit beta [Rhizobium azibense]TCU34092.1 DNA polymerase-3 subunit beta [Rhizobium azibense]